MANHFRTIIIDDDRSDVEELAKRLSQYPQIRGAGYYYNAVDGLAAVLRDKPDVVFLDIEMPGMTGLEFMERLDAKSRHHCHIVVYTAYVNHAVESFRHKALDVLLKPIDKADLDKVMTHLIIEANKSKRPTERVGDGMLEEEKHLLMYMNKSDFQVVKLCDICLFLYEEKTKRWQTYARDGNKVYSFTLKHNVYSKHLLALSPSLVQVHKKYIVNVAYLMMLKDNECVFFAPFKSIKGVMVSENFKKKLVEKFYSI